MKLEKLTITPQSPSKLKEIEVLFNPTSYSISKSVGWNSPRTTGINSGGSSSGGSSSGGSSENQNEEQTRRGLNAPQVAFGGGSARQLSLELFYDTTLPIEGITPMSDVRNETNKIVELSRIERDEEKPPVCLVSWGAAFPFRGVLTNLTQRFTLFTSSGVPLRANLTVSFREYLPPEDDKIETDPVFTTRIIKGGDTLSSIAAEIYRDPTRWRIIAEENSIDDPRRLDIGQMLSIPKLSR